MNITRKTFWVASLTIVTSFLGSPARAGAPGTSVVSPYIIVAKSEVTVDSISDTLIGIERVKYNYTTALRGFAADLTAEELERMQHNPGVAYVEPDSLMWANDDIVLPDAVQPGPPSWGLDRIDQANLPLNQNYQFNQTGKGVNVYVIDTGIMGSHTDFGGRVRSAYTAVADGNGTVDCAGHGTHVAATVGGTSYGVAKDVNLYAVRVLGCDGSGATSGVIAGIDWVAVNHVKPAVINMSLGGGVSQAIDTAVANAVAAGVTVVVAAGNSAGDACAESPARAPTAIRVAASTRNDARASFSNYGTCVDLFAPGQDITSAWIGSNSALATISGTSMASPHTAGVAALMLEKAPQTRPETIKQAIKASASKNLISDLRGSPNLLLQSDTSAITPPPDPDPVPVAPCTGCKAYEGTLSAGLSTAFPRGSYYYARAGTQQIWLRGSSTGDFDVEIMRWNGYSWVVAARADSPEPSENLTYVGRAGYYATRVKAASGSGKFQLWVKYP